MTFARESVIVFRRQLRMNLRNPAWVIIGSGARRRPRRLEGTPADLVAGRSTLTGEHLAAYVGA